MGSLGPGTQGDSCFGTCYTPATATRIREKSIGPVTLQRDAKFWTFPFLIGSPTQVMRKKCNGATQEASSPVHRDSAPGTWLLADLRSERSPGSSGVAARSPSGFGVPWWPGAVSHRHGRTCSDGSTSSPAGLPGAARSPPGRICGRAHSRPGNIQTARGERQVLAKQKLLHVPKPAPLCSELL